MAKKVEGFENITARISERLSAFLEDVKWEHKSTRAGIARRALQEWAEAHGYDQWCVEHPETPDSDAE